MLTRDRSMKTAGVCRMRPCFENVLTQDAVSDTLALSIVGVWAMVLVAAADYRVSLTALRGVDLDRQRAVPGAQEGIPDAARVMLNQYRKY